MTGRSREGTKCKFGGVLLVLVLLMSAVFSGCGTAGAGSGEEQILIWTDGGRVDTVRELAAGFTGQYEVPVRVQELAFEDIRDQLKLAAPAGEGPDIVVGAHDWLGELVANGLVEPVDLGEKREDFDEVALEAFTYDGRLYGVPYGTEALALMYNEELVPEPPETWEDLKDTARRLQEEGAVDQGYVLQEADPYHAYPIYTGFGGYVFGQQPDGSYDPSDLGLDSPGSVEAAREIRGMVEEGLLRSNIDFETMHSLFFDGRSAMFFTGPWSLGDVQEAGVEYAIAPLPEMEQQPQPFVGAQGFMASAYSENKILARTFLTEYLATEEAMRTIYEGITIGPAWVSLQDDASEDIQVFTESAQNGQPLPAIPQMSAVFTEWENAMTFLFEGQGAPEEVMSNAAREIRAELDE